MRSKWGLDEVGLLHGLARHSTAVLKGCTEGECCQGFLPWLEHCDLPIWTGWQEPRQLESEFHTLIWINQIDSCRLPVTYYHIKKLTVFISCSISSCYNNIPSHQLSIVPKRVDNGAGGPAGIWVPDRLGLYRLKTASNSLGVIREITLMQYIPRSKVYVTQTRNKRTDI